MFWILAEAAAVVGPSPSVPSVDAILQLFGQGAVAGAMLWWLARVLIPRMQDDARKDREAAATENKEARKDFLAALDKHGACIDELCGEVRELNKRGRAA